MDMKAAWKPPHRIRIKTVTHTHYVHSLNAEEMTFTGDFYDACVFNDGKVYLMMDELIKNGELFDSSAFAEMVVVSSTELSIKANIDVLSEL